MSSPPFGNITFHNVNELENGLVENECAKFRGSRAIVGLVPSCHRAFVGSNFFPWVCRGSQIFSRESFVGPKFFRIFISWAQNIFSWVFRGCKVFLMDISWVTGEHVSEE